MGQNLTVRLDEETIHKARILAARRSTSVSRLVGDEIARLVAEDDAYQKARRVALGHLARGFHLGGGSMPSRESLHAR